MLKSIISIISILLFPTTVFYMYFLSKEKTYNHILLTSNDLSRTVFCFLVDVSKFIFVVYLLKR